MKLASTYSRLFGLLALSGFVSTCCAQAPSNTPQKTLTKEATNPESPGIRPATANYPLDGIVDKSGNVWIVDLNAHCVWKYTDGQLGMAVEGSKQFRKPLNAVRSLALEPAGSLLFGDPATREVYRRKEDGQLEPIMKGIPGIPIDLAVASNGTIYVADVERRVVWSKAPDADKPTVFAAANPRGLFVDAQDNLWVVSQDAEQLQRFNAKGEKEIIVSKRVFEFPHQVVVDSKGTAFVSDGYRKAVWKIDPNQPPQVIPDGAGNTKPFQNPVGLFLVEDRLAVVDPHTRSVYKLGTDNQFSVWFTVPKPD